MSRQMKGDNFASLLTRRERFYTDPGSTERNDYEITIDKKGHKTLKCVGSHDIYDEIQSYADECKIENIIARANAGDTALLNQRQGFYADITDTPKNLAEAQNAILKLSAFFDSLPAETRAKFDNSKERFVSLYGSEEFIENMGWETRANETKQVEIVPGINESIQPLTPEENK